MSIQVEKIKNKIIKTLKKSRGIALVIRAVTMIFLYKIVHDFIH